MQLCPLKPFPHKPLGEKRGDGPTLIGTHRLEPPPPTPEREEREPPRKIKQVSAGKGGDVLYVIALPLSLPCSRTPSNKQRSWTPPDSRWNPPVCLPSLCSPLLRGPGSFYISPCIYLRKILLLTRTNVMTDAWRGRGVCRQQCLCAAGQVN